MTNKPMLSVERELRGAVEQALLAIKRVYQAGHDSITAAGGACDQPGVMFENDPTVRELRALLDKEVDGDSRAPEQQMEIVAWRHTMHFEEGFGSRSEFTGSPDHPFGKPDIDYDRTFLVTTDPICVKPPAPVATISSLMEAAHAIPGFPGLTGTQLRQLADYLNGVNK